MSGAWMDLHGHRFEGGTQVPCLYTENRGGKIYAGWLGVNVSAVSADWCGPSQIQSFPT